MTEHKLDDVKLTFQVDCESEEGQDEVATLILTRETRAKGGGDSLSTFSRVGLYAGPNIRFDLTAHRELVQVEFDYEYTEEDDLLDEDGKPFVFKGDPQLARGAYEVLSANEGSVVLGMPSRPKDQWSADRHLRLDDLLEYVGPGLVMAFAGQTLVTVSLMSRSPADRGA